MGAFIGPLGGLIEATQWQEKQSVSTGTTPSFFTGLDGARTAFVQPPAGRVLREWDIAMSGADPERAAAFQALALGAHGVGPFVFVDPYAQVTNLLTPRQSLLDPAVLTSAATSTRAVVPGLGSMPAARTKSGQVARFGYGTPVVPGRAVTVSAWVMSTSTVTLSAQCMRADGTWTTTGAESYTGLSSGRWISATVVPGPESAQVDLRVSSAAQDTVVCPSITWTREPLDWSPGRGAAQVVISGLQEEFSRAEPHRMGERRIDYSATVTEVGSGA